MHATLSTGEGALHLASGRGHVEVVGALLALRLAPDAIAKDRTPLQRACERGHKAVVQLLHKWGASIERTTSCGASPFSLAYRGGHVDVVAYLRAHSVDEHVGMGRTSEASGTHHHVFKRGVSMPQEQKKKPSKRTANRLTPMRVRAERAGVLDRYKDTPPGLRDRATDGSLSAKKQLNAIHKHNHQVVDRAEVQTAPSLLKYEERKEAHADGMCKQRRRKLALS